MDKMLRACLNWKVIGGLVVAGVGTWLVAPNLLAAAFPVLLLAVCPLSMVFMMRGMQGEHGSNSKGADQESRVAPSSDLDRGELQAMKEEIDRKIQALESAKPETYVGQPVTENGKQRT